MVWCRKVEPLWEASLSEAGRSDASPSEWAKLHRRAPKQPLGLAHTARHSPVGKAGARALGVLAGEEEPARDRLAEKVEVGRVRADREMRVCAAREAIGRP